MVFDPIVWGNDRMAVELALKQTTQCTDLTHRAPIVIPEFTKLLLSLIVAGNDSSSMYEGVQALSLVIVDRDIVNTCQANTSFNDARSLRGGAIESMRNSI
jgi:hypothetical protein